MSAQKNRPSGISFHAKIIFPVVLVLALFFGIAIYIIYQSMEKQYRSEETNSLLTSQRVFEKMLTIRQEQLASKAHTIADDVGLIAIIKSEDAKTMTYHLNEVVRDHNLGFVSYSDDQGAAVAAATRISNLHPDVYNEQYTTQFKRALEGKVITSLVDLNGYILEVATTPLIADGQMIGVITVGHHLDDAMMAEFRRLTGCEIAFYSGSRVSVASWQEAAKRLSFFGMINDKSFPFSLGNKPTVSSIKEIQVESERYLGLMGTCAIPDHSEPVRYGLFSSYQAQYLELKSTQQMLMQLGVIGVWLGGFMVWLLVGRFLRPVEGLRTSMDALAAGDYNRRVPIHAHDEIGQLNLAYNSMADNLKVSRDELEHTASKLRDTRARLMQSEKLAALGAFISGITHELNNPLTVMVGYAQLLKESDLSEDHKEDVEQIIESSERCQGIIQNLLSFARERPAERTLANLNEIVNSSLKFVLYELGTSNIQVIKELDPDPPLILADPHQIQQVILNMIKNAEQAVADSDRDPCITIRTYTESGSTVRLSIQDSGLGVPPAAMHKLFDPFFTTKEPGKGTGLGLSVSYGIIREHGGDITVENPPDSGARFIIDIPQAPKSDDRFLGGSLPETATGGSYRVAGQKILIVDDEELILNLTRKILNRCGYEVHTTGNGLEALHRLEREHYDIVLSDWKMPGMSGQEFFEQWLDTYPNSTTRFLFMTGDVLNEDMQRYIERNGSACLLKPFSLDEFRATLQMLIQSDLF